MKIIEAMKKVKDLQRKVSDIKGKITQYCVDHDNQEPVYGTYETQKKQVSEWIQACNDIVKEILNLRVAVQKTNCETEVSIDIGGKAVTQTIAAWIHRRRDLAQLNKTIYQVLDETKVNLGVGYRDKDGEERIAKRRLYFDPKVRDEKVEEYNSEPSLIDSALETVNATTDIIE